MSINKRFYLEAYSTDGSYICGMNEGQRMLYCKRPLQTYAVKSVPELLKRYKHVGTYKLADANGNIIKEWSRS